MDALARRIEGRRQIVDDRRKRRLAGAALEDFGGDGIGLEDALRREQHPAALRLVVREANAARQPRLGVARYRVAFAHRCSKSWSQCRSLRIRQACYTTTVG